MKTLNKDIENKLKELESADDIEEMNVTGNVAGYNTPNAFTGKSKKGKKKRMKSATDSTGYTVVKDIDEVKMSTYKQIISMMHLNEITYKEYKSDDSFTSKQKVNKSISEVNRKLYEIEKTINRNIKLKTETGVNSSQYWKSTKSKMLKISEKMVRISNKLKYLGS